MFTVAQRERTNFLDNRGRATDGYRVWFTMDDGTVDYIEIEKNRFNAKNVREAIEEAISEHGDLVGL